MNARKPRDLIGPHWYRTILEQGMREELVISVIGGLPSPIQPIQFCWSKANKQKKELIPKSASSNAMTFLGAPFFFRHDAKGLQALTWLCMSSDPGRSSEVLQMPVPPSNALASPLFSLIVIIVLLSSVKSYWQGSVAITVELHKMKRWKLTISFNYRTLLIIRRSICIEQLLVLYLPLQ